MLQSGDWVVPRYLSDIRTAKPVFIYWCQASDGNLRRHGIRGAISVGGRDAPDADVPRDRVIAARRESGTVLTLLILASSASQ